MTSIAIIVLLHLLFALAVPGQSTETSREIQVATWADSPLEVTEVRFRDEKLVFVGDLFPTTTVVAGDDWVSQISVVVKNVSSKSITYISMEQRNTSEKFASAAIWGATPGALGSTGKSLAPNQSVTIKFTRAPSKWIGAKRIQIFADTVFFDNDGTYMWRHGKTLKQSSADPSRYEVVPPSKASKVQGINKRYAHAQATPFCDKVFITAQQPNCITRDSLGARCFTPKDVAQSTIMCTDTKIELYQHACRSHSDAAFCLGDEWREQPTCVICQPTC